MAANERLGQPKYDCVACMRVNDEPTRAYLKCGFIPASQLKAPRDTRVVKGLALIPEVCPGFYRAHPATQELAEAWAHWSKGQVDIVWPKPLTRPQRIALNAFAGAQAAAEAWEAEQRIKQARKD